ncbi:MAG: septal ring lytic transglycosylase RlpA family protein [Deltaproteobacteria bacterium]|nr:septal ring lytic transglycosylase RlpA family protein [Deltaproteobacteria bacterium]
MAAMIRAVMRSVCGLGLLGVVLAPWLSGCSATHQSLNAERANVQPLVNTPRELAVPAPRASRPILGSLPHSTPASSQTLPPASSRTLPVILPQVSTVSQTGMASWYGPRFHGKRTASGEVYNQHALTAAHKTLPLGSRAVVTNLNTGQSVEVRINDRGPFTKGRVIDLSHAAARLVGVVGPGVAPVKVEVMSPEGQSLAQEVVPPSAYAVLLASSTDEAEALAVMNEVSHRYEDVYLSPLSSGALRYYQVRLGPFRSRDEAAQRAREVSRTGVQALVVGEADRRVER